MALSKEKIKELILTDYLDGQLDEQTKREVEAHIARDKDLQQFLAEVKETVRDPFLQTKTVHPPERVWENVKQRIEPSGKISPFQEILESIGQGLRRLWARPQVSFAWGSALAMVMIVVWIGIGQRHIRPSVYDSEQQVEYLMFLAGGDSIAGEETENGFDTTIENYFL